MIDEYIEIDEENETELEIEEIPAETPVNPPPQPASNAPSLKRSAYVTVPNIKIVQSPPTKKLKPMEFFCKKCSKKFTERDLLQSHIATHHKQPILIALPRSNQNYQEAPEGSEEFQCKDCGKLCRSESHLSTHMLKHQEFRQDNDVEEDIEPLYDAAKMNIEQIEVEDKPKLKPPSIKLKVSKNY